MLGGTFSLVETCQPARSSSSTACASGATACEISTRCSAIACVVQRGSTRPAPLPWAGQIAPKMYAEAVQRSRGAEGRVPRLAQRRVILFFWPIRASSANQISTGLPSASACAISAKRAGKSF